MTVGNDYLGAPTGIIARERFLSYNKISPKKIYVEFIIPSGSNYVDLPLSPPSANKAWQLFCIDGSVPEKTSVQVFTLNSNPLGLYIAGGDSAGAYGSFQLSDFFGPNGVFITEHDSISIKITNSGESDQTVGLSFFVNEFII